jgi:uncharacterized alkaline shock family protein YloU
MQQLSSPTNAVSPTARIEHRGAIEVSPQAIATVAGRAVAQCYGVVGIAGKHLRFGAAELLPPERYGHGIDVRFAGERITIDLYVIMEYGLRLSEVAHSAMASVKFAIEQVLGLPVVQINVIIQGLRVSDPAL